MRRVKNGILWLCWTMGFFHLARHFAKHKLRILCYHGFANNGDCRFRPKLLMNGDAFRERLRLLAYYRFNVLSLDNALNGLRNGAPAPDSVVITFDDGHYSTFSVAAPALESHNFPATVYVSTYYVEQQIPVFNLMVEYLLWKTRRPILELRGLSWARDQRVNLLDLDERGHLAREVIESIQRCDSSEGRESACRELATLLDLNYDEIRKNRTLTLMSLDELRDVASRGMDIQLHTHRHRLPEDDEEASKQEILENRRVLGAVANAPLRHFCYPSGLWSKRHWERLAELGIESATTCEPGLNDQDTPLLALRRIVDGEDVSKIEFLSEIFGFACLLRGLRDCIRPKAIAGSRCTSCCVPPGSSSTR